MRPKPAHWSQRERLTNAQAGCTPYSVDAQVGFGAGRKHSESNAITSGEFVWRYDSTVPVPTSDGGEARGGSFGGAAGPVVAGNRLLLSSGYGIYGHMPGAALLVFEPARKSRAADPADDTTATGRE